MFAPDVLNSFARDVRNGLSQPGQKQLPCEYFYDEVGSALFEAITVLPEYGLTRADARLVRRLAPELADYLRVPATITELGSGSGSKTRWILESLMEHGRGDLLSDRYLGLRPGPMRAGTESLSPKFIRSKTRT